MAETAGNYLVISDLQIPFEASRSLEFSKYCKRHFSVPDENVLCVGDEVDQLFGGMYRKDPDGTHTANSEIRESKEKIREWACAFPNMRIANSNHGNRWKRKAFESEIPSTMMRRYQEVLEIPEGWRYADRWTIQTDHPFMMKHGMDLGGKTPYRLAAEMGSISVLFGHLHSSAGIAYVATSDKKIWAMNTGCLIDIESYVFAYNRDDRWKPTLGLGVVLNKGRMPIWVPYEY